MRLTRLTVLALAVALFAAPIGAEAQPARRAHRVGILIPGAPAPSDRATVSLNAGTLGAAAIGCPGWCGNWSNCQSM